MVILGICAVAGLIRYPLYLAWAYVVVRAFLPGATAMAGLLRNRRYYASLYRKGE